MNLHRGELVGGRNGHDCIDCSICGFIHLGTPPSQEELRAFYKEEFYQMVKPRYAAEEEQDEAWHTMLYQDRWDQVMGIARSNGAKVRHVLDIGCGTGHFLRYLAKQDGIERALGLEPSTRIAPGATPPGVEVITQSWERVEWERYGTFDLITAQFVLEHLLDPLGLIQLVAERLLNEGGIFYVGVPNDFREVQFRAASRINRPFYWVHYPEHINYFNVPSLKAVLKKKGLEPVLDDATYPMEGYLLSGLNYLDDPALGRRLHRERMTYELSLDAVSRETRRAASRRWGRRGLGRDALLYAVKKGRGWSDQNRAQNQSPSHPEEPLGPC
jgi:SAM-dependent methyltransferase